jgi:hypothetical protein
VATIKAPTSFGNHTGSVTGTLGFSGSFQINTIPLPATNGGGISVSNSSPQAGVSFTVTVDGCQPGSTQTIRFAGSSQTATANAAGDLSIRVTAPTTPGLYEITVSPCSKQTLSIRIVGRVGFTGGETPATTTVSTTASPATPATGASGTAEMMLMASGLLAMGLGLLAVAQIRRRQDELVLAQVS